MPKLLCVSVPLYWHDMNVWTCTTWCSEIQVHT